MTEEIDFLNDWDDFEVIEDDTQEDDWINLTDCCCQRCESLDVKMQEVRSSLWDFKEYHFECLSCEHRWWIDAKRQNRKHMATEG
jgi:hypothetical protein